MKHVDLFNEFLNDVVNLNQTRIADLETSIDAIKEVVGASSWKPKIKEWAPQGSWAHKTIIKPVDQGEFDADLLVYVDPVQGWSAATYIEELYNVFKDHDTYKDKVKRWSHCVTITYASQKKIDIAPCIVNRDGFTRLEVCNRNTDQFERTEPKRYTDWLIQQNSYSGSNSFRKVTRLIKYLRDIKTRFTCSTVLLTTILGYRISAADQDSDNFDDAPKALKTIFGRMDDWLQANANKPQVTNPFLSTENFAADWTDEQYETFRERVHTYREWIDDAFNEQDRDDSIAKWRRVFGHDFAKGVVIEEAKSVAKSAVALLKSTVSTAALFTGDLVEAIRRYGARVIPSRIYHLPYMDQPTWRQSPSMMPVNVKASLHGSKDGPLIKAIADLEPLTRGRWLHFQACTNTGLPFTTSEYRVEWRVTNTDEAAYNDNDLRGEFYLSHSNNTRWEALKYRGVHLVEAFVVRKRGDLLVGRSEPFRVLIE
jgi:hypothetical protein